MRLLLACLLVACASPKPTPKAAGPEPEEMGRAPEAAPASCEDACTEIAVCWEDVNGGDYNQGGFCVEECGENEATFIKCVAEAADCDAMLQC